MAIFNSYVSLPEGIFRFWTHLDPLMTLILDDQTKCYDETPPALPQKTPGFGAVGVFSQGDVVIPQ